MANGMISGELMEELYSVNDGCFFDSCWEGHDDLEQAIVDWAKKDFKAAISAADEHPAKLEALIRETGDDVLADFVNHLDTELRREALALIVERLEDMEDDTYAAELKARLDDLVSEIS